VSRGEALVEERRNTYRPLLAVVFLFIVASTVFAGGQGESRLDDRPAVPEPRESLEQADERIDEQRYDEAVVPLVDAVEADEEQLPAAEERFEEIRDAQRAWVAKGQEVRAELNELIAGDIPADQVVPTAFQALRLIDEMRTVLPYPNPEAQRTISELQSRVLLTIDRRRFEALMDAALAELDAGNYVRAAEIYVDGLGEYGFDVPDGQSGGRTTAGAQTDDSSQIVALLETDGLSIQIGSFNPGAYELSGERFAAARETVRAQAVHSEEEGELAFTDIAVPASTQAREMTASFAAGDFARARARIDDYLPLLRQLTEVYRTIASAGEIIAEQEKLNAERAVVDEEYAYNWHIRFVNYIVLGRPIETGAEERRPEGVLHTVESVWDAVASAPLDATREFGARRYASAVDDVRSFPWSDLRSPDDDTLAREHVDELDALLESIAVSYRTSMSIVNLARELELEVPDPGTESSAETLRPLVEAIREVDQDGLRRTLLEAIARVASSEELDDVLANTRDAFDRATPLDSRSNIPMLDRQRSDVRSFLAVLYEQAERWESFAVALQDAAAGDALDSAVVEDATPEHQSYVAERISQVRDYELAVVQQIANIQIDALNERLTAHEETVRAATRELDAIDPVSGAPRPRTDDARDRLRPVVGTVVGTRITNTSTGTLAALRSDAQTLAGELRGEEQYIVPDEEIQAVIARADEIAATIGDRTAGLLGNASSLLERSLRQIARARDFEERALARVDEIEDQISEAISENEAGNVVEASTLLDRAEELLSSNRDDDASNLFTASLENWYRSTVENRWDELRERLSASLNEARRGIVVARVDDLATQAEPLVDPPPGEDPRPGEAILILEEAEALWSTVYPLVQNPTITPLLRRARILESAQQQVLTEDIPGYDRLSQILNTARTAFEEGNYETAQRALDFFLFEQPLNAEARLLDIRLELATGTGSADAIVRGYVTRSLDEVTEADNDGTQIESQVLEAARRLRATEGRSGSVPQEVFGELLTLRSKLRAIDQIAREQGGVSLANRNRIEALLNAIATVINPPQPPPPPEENREQIAMQIINGLPEPGTWQRLPVDQQTAVYEELVRARNIFPGSQRTEELIALIQSYLPSVRLPSPAEQAIMTRSNRLVQQGDLEGALAELEAYMARTDANPALQDPMLIPDWRELYNDLIRRLRRQ
jgi:hypothetical protein